MDISRQQLKLEAPMQRVKLEEVSAVGKWQGDKVKMAPKARKRKVAESVGQAEIIGRVYGRQADSVSQALRQVFPDLQVELNPEKPRRNSFEVTLVKEGGSKVELWSGIKKGPPRKLKFPEPEVLVEDFKKHAQ
ncbi:selenoprotein H [Ambystoma mexicanum]|uniref:selenoprotein H n=1 Tax=Ambystoma mexicanum TaxID=8296 RepID=UPI0037E7410A